MKRLSLRLSVVGAVLALGAAAIAHSVLRNNGEEPGDTGKSTELTKVTPAADQTSPPPIVVERDTTPTTSPAEKALRPPPSSFFERPASHLASDDETTKSATPIDTVDPTDSSGSFPLSQPNDELPEAVADATSGDFPAPPAYTPNPAASSYGTTSLPPDPSAATASIANELNADTVTEQPVSATPLADPTAPPSSSFPTAAPLTNASPPVPPSGFGELTTRPTAPPTTLPTAGGAFGTTTERTLADDTPSGSSTSRGSTGVPGTTGQALAAGVAGGIAGAAVASGLPAGGLPDTQQDAGTMPPPRSPTVGGYPSTGAASNPALASGNAYGTAPNTPSSNMVPAAPSAYSNNGYTTAEPYRSQPGSATPYSASPAASAGLDSPAALMASNVPGDRQLEGQQAPTIVIEKSAPEEIQVNRKAVFQMRVRNNGNAPAYNVVVVDRVPNGTQFIDATPPANPTADGTLVWQIATVKPGEEVVLSMNLMPQVAGEIGSVAQATFQTQASVRTICTQPELKLDVTIPEEVLIGQPASLEITITNVGNGAAEKVVIEEDVPEGFTHAAGRELEHEIGVLRPQESRRLTLVLDSAKAGTYENRLTIRGEGDLFAEDVRPIRISTPLLQVAMQGPSLRYLDRQATYAVHLANPGTASARNVELVTYLPKGMKYVTSDNQGQYDTQSHAVFWSLEELPADKQGDVHVTVLPIEPGNQKIKTDVRAELGLNEVCEHEVTVEGLAELSFIVSDVADPIEVGSETTYEIKVHNRGSKGDTDIQLVAVLPAGITPTSGDGPTQATVQGQQVVFGTLARLGPSEEAVFKIHALGAATGDHVIRVQLRSAELRVPVTKEEITRVYTDN